MWLEGCHFELYIPHYKARVQKWPFKVRSLVYLGSPFLKCLRFIFHSLMHILCQHHIPKRKIIPFCLNAYLASCLFWFPMYCHCLSFFASHLIFRVQWLYHVQDKSITTCYIWPCRLVLLLCPLEWHNPLKLFSFISCIFSISFLLISCIFSLMESIYLFIASFHTMLIFI